MGIENIKEVIKFVCELVEGLVKSLEDDKFNFADLIHFYDAGKALPAAIDDVKDIPEEFMDLDEEEQQALIDYITEEFDIPEDKVEAFVERLFRAGIYLADAVEAGFDAFKKQQT
jgi:arginine/ornithine N-succinyltransferase beta subunit